MYRLKKICYVLVITLISLFCIAIPTNANYNSESYFRGERIYSIKNDNYLLDVLKQEFSSSEIVTHITYSIISRETTENLSDLYITVNRVFLDDTYEKFVGYFFDSELPEIFVVAGYEFVVMKCENAVIEKVKIINFYEDSVVISFESACNNYIGLIEEIDFDSFENISIKENAAIVRRFIMTGFNYVTPWRTIPGQGGRFRLPNPNDTVNVNVNGGSNISIGVSVRVGTTPLSVSVSARTGSAGASVQGLGLTVGSLANQFVVAQLQNTFDVRKYEQYYSSRPGQTRQIVGVPTNIRTSARLVRS